MQLLEDHEKLKTEYQALKETKCSPNCIPTPLQAPMNTPFETPNGHGYNSGTPGGLEVILTTKEQTETKSQETTTPNGTKRCETVTSKNTEKVKNIKSMG